MFSSQNRTELGPEPSLSLHPAIAAAFTHATTKDHHLALTFLPPPFFSQPYSRSAVLLLASFLEHYVNMPGPLLRFPKALTLPAGKSSDSSLSVVYNLTSCSASLISCCSSLVLNTQSPRTSPSPTSNDAFSCLYVGAPAALLESSCWLSSYKHSTFCSFPGTLCHAGLAPIFLIS